MSKLACPCGNILRDCGQDDTDSNWGYIIKNKEWFDYQDEVSKILSGLFEAYKTGKHIEWIKNNCPIYSDQPLESIISDIMTRLNLELGVCYAKCNNCNSLLIQSNKHENKYTRFKKEEL